MPEFKMEDLTPEQRKEMLKIISRARLRLFGISAKFALGLFGSNMAAIVVCVAFFKDADPETIAGFEFFSLATNFIFMVVYLYNRLKENSDIVFKEIEAVLKKQ